MTGWRCGRKHLSSRGPVITVVRVATVGVTRLEVFVLIASARSGNDPVPERSAMYESPLKRVRRRVGAGMFSVVVVGTLWSLSPGMPVLREPSAPPQLKQTGLELFRHEWEPNDPQAHGDGLGPVYNARSCVACHSQGGIGGAGDNAHNVTAFVALPTKERPEIQGGLVHHFATDNRSVEGSKELLSLFPLIPHVTLVINGCQTEVRDFNPVHLQRVNPTSLFGAGWIDRISEKAIRTQGAKTSAALILQELGGDFRVTTAGRPRILPDGRVGKFGWKAQFATLEEFVAAACANELGLGNPVMPQARPLACRGEPATGNDLDPEQFRALVAFVDTIPRPIEVLPDDAEQRERSGPGGDSSRTSAVRSATSPTWAGSGGFTAISCFTGWAIPSGAPGTMKVLLPCRFQRTIRVSTSGRPLRSGAWPTRRRTCMTGAAPRSRKPSSITAAMRRMSSSYTSTWARKIAPP